jgi:hypothetical protein
MRGGKHHLSDNRFPQRLQVVEAGVVSELLPGALRAGQGVVDGREPQALL